MSTIQPEALRLADAMNARTSHGQAPAEATDYDAIALARYKVVLAHESMFHRFAVVAGDGNQQLFIGREVECHNMARKFAGAFLDGAFYRSHYIVKADCSAGSTCSTCPDMKKCERGCLRQLDTKGTAPAPAPSKEYAEWVPVTERLPEPGIPVLLDIGAKYPIRAAWAAKATLEAFDDDSDWAEYDEETGSSWCPEGWYEWNQHEEVHWAVNAAPVAWCELPPLASEAKGAT